HPHDEEEDREDVREPDGAGEAPVHLLEGDAEDRREEEEAGDFHSRPLRSVANSSTRVSRARRRRVASSSGVPSSWPACQRACRASSASRIAATSSGGATTPAPVSSIRAAAAPSGGH